MRITSIIIVPFRPCYAITSPMTPRNIRRWAWIHKWSSLVCTVFMLLLCLTGLPLIYHHEIDHLLGNDVAAPAPPPAHPGPTWTR
jgi:uncharacterized iron-regulated membrane protein